MLAVKFMVHFGKKNASVRTCIIEITIKIKIALFGVTISWTQISAPPGCYEAHLPLAGEELVQANSLFPNPG